MTDHQGPQMMMLDATPGQALPGYELLLKSGEHGHLQTGPDGLARIRLPDGRTVAVDRNGTIVDLIG